MNTVGEFGLTSQELAYPFTEWVEKVEDDSRNEVKELLDALLESDLKEFRTIFKIKNVDNTYVTIFFGGHLMEDENHTHVYAGVIECLGMVERIDSLTNLWTTSVMLTQLNKLKQQKQPFTILLFGINNFSEINKRYGYAYGDQILKDLTKKFLTILDEYILFKGEGVKFYVLSKQLDSGRLEMLYSTIRDYLRYDYYVNDEQVVLEISGGIEYYTDFDLNIDTMHSVLGLLFHNSKYEKQGELQHCPKNYVSEVGRNLEIVSFLRKEIVKNSHNFHMVYQPFVSSNNEKIVGGEALVRYESKELGKIPPGIFIPLLESDPVFNDLSNWILEQSLSEAKHIVQQHKNFILNVNLSYSQLQHHDFEPTLKDILDRTNYPPTNLCLELTERCRLLDLDFLRKRLLYIKSLGIKIALDDFGTGFSSLTLVQKLPIDVIKIDRGFVMDIKANNIQQSLVKCICLLAMDLNIEITIEGIETYDMKEFLKKYGPSKFQGYYYSKPIVYEEFKELDFFD